MLHWYDVFVSAVNKHILFIRFAMKTNWTSFFRSHVTESFETQKKNASDKILAGEMIGDVVRELALQLKSSIRTSKYASQFEEAIPDLVMMGAKQASDSLMSGDLEHRNTK